jgi:hypothetical protein
MAQPGNNTKVPYNKEDDYLNMVRRRRYDFMLNVRSRLSRKGYV